MPLGAMLRRAAGALLQQRRSPTACCRAATTDAAAVAAEAARLSEKQQRRMDVLIVGGSSGVGAALARRLSLRGDRVSLCLAGRRASQLEGVAEGCRSRGGAAVSTTVGDVGREADAARMCAAFVDTLRDGALPVVVCNQGIGAPGPTDAFSADAFGAVLQTNVTGVALTLRALLPVLRAAPASQIVVTSSVLGLRPPSAGGNAAYTSSKHAVEGLVEAVRLEVAGSGIKLGVVNPGGIRTEWFDDQTKGGYTQAVDTTNFLAVEEVVDALLAIIDQAPSTDIRRIVLENHTPLAAHELDLAVREDGDRGGS